MSSTEQNLAEAFAGESQANRKYLAFAKKAERDGYPQAARLFRAAAAAETVHAHAHLRALGGIRSTKENLQEALAGETHEFKNMYPDMIRAAEEKKKAIRLQRGRFPMPMKLNRNTPPSIKRLWIVSTTWRSVIITSAPYVDIPTKKKLLRNARSAAPMPMLFSRRTKSCCPVLKVKPPARGESFFPF